MTIVEIRWTLDTCHVVIVHSCSITCIHVSCFLQSLSTQFFFFYMYVPCIFVYFNSTCHVSFVSLHACIKYLCFFTCLCNVSYYHSSCECRLFAKFLQNKLPYWHWRYWGDLVNKKKRKIKPIITFKQKYVSIIGYSPSPIFFIYIFQGLSNSKCAMKCRLYKDRDLRCARIA